MAATNVSGRKYNRIKTPRGWALVFSNPLGGYVGEPILVVFSNGFVYEFVSTSITYVEEQLKNGTTQPQQRAMDSNV
jgi:hypothetical protein